MKEIELTRGFTALVDSEDFDKFNNFSWHCTSHGYVARRDKENKHHYLHRDVLQAKKGQIVDHINGNRLDNRKENLRICSQAENVWNTSKRKLGIVPLRGVYVSDTGAKNSWKLKKKFASKIKVNGKGIWLGRFETAEEAHEAYKKACLLYRGKFARFD